MKMKPITYSQEFKEGEKTIQCEIQFNSGAVYLSVELVAIRDQLCSSTIHRSWVPSLINKQTKDSIEPTIEQRQTIDALCNGDIRGNYAENIVYDLFVDLFVLNPKAGLSEFLPSLVANETKKHIEFGWPRQSR